MSEAWIMRKEIADQREENRQEPNVPVSYEELAPEGNTVVLELKGVRVPKSLERALDTSEFKSAVKLVSTYQAGDNARVVVQLRENVGHRVTQDGNTYFFDFDRPSGMSGSEMASAPASTSCFVSSSTGLTLGSGAS